MPDFDNTELGTTAAEVPSEDGNLAAVWDGLHAESPHDGTNEQAMPATAPLSWSAPMRQRLSSLPPEYRDVIQYAAQRDKEQHEAITRYGQQVKQYEPLRKLIHEFGLPEHTPIEDVVRHLEGALGQGDATKSMRQLAEEYQQNYEPLKATLDQYADLFDGQPPQSALAALLQQARALRTDPNAVLALARERGFPGVEQAVTLQQQLSEMTARESRRTFDDFARDKPHLADDGFQQELVAEMRALQKETAGLKGEPLLRLAYDRVAERTGISKQIEEKRRQEQEQRTAERDAAWRAIFAEHQAEQLKIQQEQAKQRQREAIEHTRQAKKAASVNVKGSPGHGTNPKSLRDTLSQTWDRLNG